MGFLNIFQSGPQKKPPYKKDHRQPECPYCKTALLKTPAKKSKCPQCGQFMFVRTRPNDNVRAVVTEDEAEKIDEEWSIVGGTHDSYIADKNLYSDQREALLKRFGSVPSDSDVKWSVLNKQATNAMQKNDFQELSGIYFEMALHLYKTGREFKKMLEQSKKMYLINQKNSNIVTGVEVFSDHCCDECKKLNKWKFTVADALEKMPLPVLSCTNQLSKKAQTGWCTCQYLPVIE